MAERAESFLIGYDASVYGPFVAGGTLTLGRDTGSQKAALVYSVAADLHVGLRVGTLRFDVDYVRQEYASSAQWKSASWGQLSATLRYVAARQLSVDLSAHTLVDGGGAFLSLGWYPVRRLGVNAAAQLESGRVFDTSTMDYTNQSGTLGLSYWASRRAGLTLEYTFYSLSPTMVDYQSVLEHQLSLTFSSRM